MGTKRPEHISFDRKIAVILDENMSAITAMIVLAHIMLSLGNHGEDLVGEELSDRSGNAHLALSKYPVVLLRASASRLKDFIKKAKFAGVQIVDFPLMALDIWTDAELAAELQGRTEDEVEFLGAAIYASPETVDHFTGSMGLFRPRIP